MFLAAVDVVRKDSVAPISVPWAIGVARHKSVDPLAAGGRRHRGRRAWPKCWRHPTWTILWDIRLGCPAGPGGSRSAGVLHRTGPCCATWTISLVAQVAAELGRTLHATEAFRGGPGEGRLPASRDEEEEFDGSSLRSSPGPPVPVDPTPEFAGRLRARSCMWACPTCPKESLCLHCMSMSSPAPAPGPPRSEGGSFPISLLWAPETPSIGIRKCLAPACSASPVVMPDGRIGHAELELAGGGRIMLSEEHPEIGVVAPLAGGGVPESLSTPVFPM